MCNLNIGHIGRKAIVDFLVDGKWKPTYATCKNGEDRAADWVLQGSQYCEECFLETLKQLIYDNETAIKHGSANI